MMSPPEATDPRRAGIGAHAEAAFGEVLAVGQTQTALGLSAACTACSACCA